MLSFTWTDLMILCLEVAKPVVMAKARYYVGMDRSNVVNIGRKMK